MFHSAFICLFVSNSQGGQPVIANLLFTAE